VDEVFPKQPVREWVLRIPITLRFLFARRHAVMDQVLGIVYRSIATHLIKKAGFSRNTAQTGAVTLIQRFGSAGRCTRAWSLRWWNSWNLHPRNCVAMARWMMKLLRNLWRS